MRSALTCLFAGTLWSSVIYAHVAPFHKGMYCRNGNTDEVNLNTNAIVNPLYQLSFKDWWFHHVDKCDEHPPAPGDFLELPAGGSFTVEMASNQAHTSLSYDGKFASDWPDGKTYPEDYNVPSCIVDPNLHAQNQSMAAGTAFAISYESDIKKVTPDNLAVFSIRYHTPFKRLTSYDVPAALPACPPEGCICAWGWIPNGCGQPNMYHSGFRCNVTGATSTTPIAPPVAPVWCEDDPSKCVRGSKQMLYWNQNEGNNIEVSGSDLSGHPKVPVYNAKCGFADGAQNDIFVGPPAGQDQQPGGDEENNGGAAPASSDGATNSSNGGQGGPAPPASTGSPSQTQDSYENNDSSAPPLPAPTTKSSSGVCRSRGGGRHRRSLTRQLPPAPPSKRKMLPLRHTTDNQYFHAGWAES